ncbi:hypothetical protein ACIRVF_31440 [Kitasatospora sp. NPDC101157]|uniref:hypothetical protein n=1 Tax=Kitasatospora sp. NPDC101157 TaxID=3364098 RepID=UPI00382A4A2C
MATDYSYRVPGYVAAAQEMGAGPLNYGGHNFADVNGFREAYGVTFYLKGGQGDWFHFAIPITANIDTTIPNLTAVGLLFHTDFPVALEELTVWDGKNQIWAQQLGVSGDQTNTWQVGINLWSIGAPGPHYILTSLGFSVQVVAPAGDATVGFVCARADVTYQ